MKDEIEEYLSILSGGIVHLAPFGLRGPLWLKRFPLLITKVFGRKVVFALVEDDALSPNDYTHHAAALSERTGCPVVFVFKSISGSRRNAFLRASVGFIIPKNQMFIPPFIDVKEWRPRIHERKDLLGNVAQVVVIREIVKGDVEGKSFCDLAARLGYSSTMITNAVMELVAHDLVEVVGRRPKALMFKAKGVQLWKLAGAFLRSPVKKKLFNRKLPVGRPSAGLTALSERSMMAAPSVPVFAVTNAILKDSSAFESAESKDDAASELEVWSYDPGVVGAVGVDDYSLYLSLRETSDPRVLGELEDRMEKLK